MPCLVQRLDPRPSEIEVLATTPPPADFENINEGSTVSEWISFQIIQEIYHNNISGFINEAELKDMFKMLAPMPDYVITQDNQEQTEEIAVSVTRAMYPCPHHMNTFNVRGDYTDDEAYRLLFKKIRALLVVFEISDIDCRIVRPWSLSILHILSESDYITGKLMAVYPDVMVELKSQFPDMPQVDIMITTIPSVIDSTLRKKIFAGY